MGWDKISSIIARILAAYPIHSIIVSIFLCIALSAGLIHIHLEQDIRKSFSPEDSAAGYETKVWLDYYDLKKFPERVFCMFSANENENLLSDEALDEIRMVDQKLEAAVRVREIDGSLNCDPLCDLNKPFHLFINDLKNTSKIATKNFTFPDYPFMGDELFLGLHFSQIDEDSRDGMRTKTLVLWYFSRSDTPSGNPMFRKTVDEMFELSQNETSFKHLKFTIFSDIIANREMIRGAIDATTLMTIGFFLLVTQVIIVVVRLSSCKAAVSLVAASLLIPIAATIAAFGMICWMGFPTFSIQCVTPFLVLGIGVDDAFILLHRWKHYSSISNTHQRLEQVIVDVGPSITITSLTNIIAFGIGFFTPTPQMSLFCLTASLALLLDYIFTYTLLAPIVLLTNDASYVPVIKRSLDEEGIEESEEDQPTWLTKYSDFVCSMKGRLCCLILMIIMYSFTAYGVVTMRATFEPAKAFPSNSKLVTALQSIKPVFNTYFPITVIVNHPPNIENETERSDFYRLMSDLESIPGIRANNRSLLFLPHYEKFDRGVSEMVSFLFGEHTPSYDRLQFWLDSIGNPPIVKMKQIEGKNDTEIKAFRFTLLGQGMSEWAERARAMQHVRTILHQNPQFNATVFDYDSAILSIILTVGQDLIGSIAVTVVCMALVCLVFIANINAVAVITSVIASICFVLVGGLSWWGADLDPVIQVDILLATGFSVDYTAHVAYNYFRAKGTSAQRVYCSLAEMAMPMFEAGLSTFLCMLPLIFVPTYAIVCFAKTVFLVVAVGLLHGLFILPVILSLFSSKNPVEEKKAPEALNGSDQPLVDKSILQNP